MSQSWSWFLTVLGTLVTAAATWIFSLGMWRYQLIAKRRYEVVEQALTIVDSAARNLHFIRRAKSDSEALTLSNPQILKEQPLFATQTRLAGTARSFDDLDNAVKSISLHFGESAAKPLIDLLAIYQNLSAAYMELYHRSAAEKLYSTQGQRDQAMAWKQMLEYQGQDDPLSRQIDQIHTLVRQRFGKHLRPNVWDMFLPFWG